MPYRNQIATVRSAIDQHGIDVLHNITIDTVERYQGSQRDYIIYGFTVQQYNQLNFLTNNVFVEDGMVIDRKLNVAMTRARLQLLMVGNADILMENFTFYKLLMYLKEKDCFFDIPPTEYCKGKFFKPEIYDDTPDPWGMNEPYVGHNGEELKLLKNPDGVFDGMKSIQIIEDGEIYLGVEAFFGLGLTRVRIGYKIYKDGTNVDVDVNVFPNEASKAIKVSLDVDEGSYVGEQIFGKEELFNDGRECIAQNFVALETEKDNYLEIVTQDSFGSSYKDGKIALTLVKTATYCAHPVPDRPLLRDGIFISKIDQGQRDFSFRLTTAKENELKKHADAFVEKPYALNVFPTIDEKDDNGFTVSGDNANISFVTLKKARQANGYIARLQNNSENAAQETVKFGNKSINLTFGKYEVKTVIYDGDKLYESKEMLI